MAFKLTPALRRHLKVLARAEGWRVQTNNAHCFAIERLFEEGVQQSVWMTGIEGWDKDADAPRNSVMVIASVTFETLETQIEEIVRCAGLTGGRSAQIHVTALQQPDDPDLSMGIPLGPTLDDTGQADHLWHFYRTRAQPLLTRLQSPEALSDLTAPAPGGGTFTWSTRQMLWAALKGRRATAERIAAEMEARGPTTLTSPVRRLQAAAAERGHTVLMHPDELDHTTAPVWQEFVACAITSRRCTEPSVLPGKGAAQEHLLSRPRPIAVRGKRGLS